MNINHTVTERFLKYVQIDTQSDPLSKTFPSTEKQKDLARVLVDELLEMGIEDAHMDEHGYVYATIPSNTDKDVPVICFCSHMDTSPDSSGKGVKPLIHKNYDGNDIVLPDDETQVISPRQYPLLKDQIGNDIVTASGTTLLGADNKAGRGSIEDETFSADGATITVKGVSQHPGFAKGRMESALKAIGEMIAKLPKDRLSPESTEAKEGFVHPVRMGGTVEEASVTFIVRDFTDKKLESHENELREIMNEVMKNYPNSTAELTVKEQYRNMKKILDQHPNVVSNAVAAIKRSGLTPKQDSIRGGTDGSRLSYMGLPCPNIFAGEHAFHSKHEWVSVQDMQKSAETIVHLCMIWEENA